MKLVIINNTSGSISGGYQKYLENLIPKIESHPKISTLKVFVPEPLIERFKNIDYYFPITNNRLLIQEVLNSKPDVVFSPTMKYLYKWPIPFVAMIHNMEPHAYDNKFNPIQEKIKNYTRKVLSKHVCMKSDGIIAVSKYVKQFLINDFHINENKIKEIYHGKNKSYINNNTEQFLENQIFAAGSIRPARGLEDIILAFSMIKSRFPKLKLKIAGKVEPVMKNYKKSLDNLINNHGLTKRIIWLDYVDTSKMIELFNESKVFVMTSRVEACPNLAIEAMKYGNYIISSENEPMPEFFRNGAIYYSEKNHNQLAKKLEETLLLKRPDLIKYNKINMKNLDRFDWDICANSTVSFLEEVIEKSH